MERGAAIRRQLGFDALARDLVPECEPTVVGAQHAAAVGFTHRLVRARNHRVDHSALQSAGFDRYQFDDALRGGTESTETRQHGIAHRSGHRFARRCQQFTDVKRIAAGQPMQSAGVAASCARKFFYRTVRQRRQVSRDE